MIATERTTTTTVVRVRRLERDKVWQGLGLGFAPAVAAVLNLWNLAQNGYGDTYYSVAVQSMLQSWRNFFYVAYDAGGVISVDKPPVALWIQALSARLLGFNPLALLLPEALAGVAAVALLYVLVRRLFGPLAGFVAALALAITPIAVAVNRDNETDTLLMCTLLLAAWALILALEKGRFRLLALSMALVGVAFNIKMLEAWIILPAFYGLYLLAAPLKWYKRLLHLGLATGVVLAVSLSWAVAVDLTPAADRPWVGGSQTNSVLELAFGYNGLARITGQGQGAGGGFGGARPGNGFQGGGQGGGPGNNGAFPQGAGGVQPFAGGATGFGGSQGLFGAGVAGPLRLFTGGVLGEQWSWLFPLALFGVLAAGLAVRRKLPLEPRGQALLLWGGWLAMYGIVFSMAEGTFHPYYLIMLAPAAGALVGIGVAALWSAYRAGGWPAWLLPGALLATALWQIKLLSGYPQWAVWLIPLTLGGSLLAAIPLATTRLLAGRVWRRMAPALLGVGLVAGAVSPLSWAVTPVLAAPTNASLPLAGPATLTDTSASWTQVRDTAHSALLAYLAANSAGYFYLVAVNNAQEASSLTLESGRPVLAAGGFMGTDPALTATSLAAMVAARQVRFVLGLTSGGMGGSGNSANNSTLNSWVQTSCVAVDPSLYGGQAGTGNAGRGAAGGFLTGLSGTLYDCAQQ